MSLRKVLGADVDRIHEQVDALLDSEDAMILLVDGSRAINYSQGFGISPSQLELLALQIERAIRIYRRPHTSSGRSDCRAIRLAQGATGTEAGSSKA